MELQTAHRGHAIVLGAHEIAGVRGIGRHGLAIVGLTIGSLELAAVDCNRKVDFSRTHATGESDVGNRTRADIEGTLAYNTREDRRYGAVAHVIETRGHTDGVHERRIQQRDSRIEGLGIHAPIPRLDIGRKEFQRSVRASAIHRRQIHTGVDGV